MPSTGAVRCDTHCVSHLPPRVLDAVAGELRAESLIARERAVC